MTDFDFSKLKVLLCDTDPEVMDVIRTTYLEAGIGDFVATPSPKEALANLPKLEPDLILVALKLPGITGIEVIQKIRSLNDGQFYKTPILMLLEKVSQNLLREACRAGIEGALRKPISAEKVLRFSRAVIIKPRRFICVRHYFGPERRMHSDPHFEGTERRDGFKPEDTSTGQFTRSRSGGRTGGGSTKAGVVLSPNSSGGSSSGGANALPDWGSSSSRPDNDGGTMDLSGASAAEKANGDFGLTDDVSSKSKSEDFDFTSQDKPQSSPDDIDYGSSSDVKNKQPDLDTKATKEKAQETDETVKEAKAPEKPEDTKIEASGPDDEEFEEIIDLEECLEQHKTWVNSGGKTGQQAQRPHSDFRGQELAEVDFTRAVLPQSNFENVDCTSTVFRKADLSGATFKSALLSSADMRVSRLNKADMRNARMDKTNLLGADLSGANLEGATLRGVNLHGANLHLTNLRGVNLASAQGLMQEQVKRAITDQTTRLPLNLTSRTAS